MLLTEIGKSIICTNLHSLFTFRDKKTHAISYNIYKSLNEIKFFCVNLYMMKYM